MTSPRTRLITSALSLTLLVATSAASVRRLQIPPRLQPAPALKLRPTHSEVPFIHPRPERVFDPVGVVALRKGGIILLDARTGLVAKRFSPQGKCTQTFSCVAGARADDAYLYRQGIAESSDGRLFVSDYEHGVAAVFAPDGKRLGAFRVAGEHRPSAPLYLAADGGSNLYVADPRGPMGDCLVAKFSLAGRLLWRRTLSRGSLNYDFGATATDHRGRLWVWWDADGIGPMLSVFNADGSTQVNKAVTLTGGPATLSAAAFDGSGNRYELWYDTIAGYGTDLVKRDPSGRELWRHNWVAVEGAGLAVRRDGTAYVVMRDFKFIAPVCVEVSSAGVPRRVLGSNGTAPGELRDPAGLAIGRAGRLYVGDYYNCRIQMFTRAGRLLGKLVGPAMSPQSAGQTRSYGYRQDSPCSIATDSVGRIYVTHNAEHRLLQQTISIFAPTGRLIRDYSELTLGYGGYTSPHFGASPRFPAAVAVDSSGHMWAAIVREPVYVREPRPHQPRDVKQGVRVLKLDRAGKTVVEFGRYGKGPGEFGQPPAEGIGVSLLAVDAQDGVWVADPGNNRVQRFDRDGRYTGEIGVGAARLKCPWGVAVDKRGDIYVGDATRVCTFDGRGRFRAVAACLADRPPHLAAFKLWPYRGLAVDGSGNILVTDATADSVRRFVPRSRSARGA